MPGIHGESQGGTTLMAASRVPKCCSTPTSILSRPPTAFTLNTASGLAHDIFKRDIYRPEPPELSGVQANFKDPQFTTAIGLIRYAQIIEAEREPKRGVFRKIGNVLWPFSR